MAASVVAALAIQTATPATFALADELTAREAAAAQAAPQAGEAPAVEALPAVVEAGDLSGMDVAPVVTESAEGALNAPGDVGSGAPDVGMGETGLGDSAAPDAGADDFGAPGEDSGADGPDAPETGDSGTGGSGVGGDATDPGVPDAGGSGSTNDALPPAEDDQPGEDAPGVPDDPSASQAPDGSRASTGQLAQGAATTPDAASDVAGAAQVELAKPVPGADGPTSPTNASTRAGVSIYDFVTQGQIDAALATLSDRAGASSSEVSLASLLAYADQYCGLPYVWAARTPTSVAALTARDSSPGCSTTSRAWASTRTTPTPPCSTPTGARR